MSRSRSSANGGRARFTRDVANITMDLNDVERVELNYAGRRGHRQRSATLSGHATSAKIAHRLCRHGLARRDAQLLLPAAAPPRTLITRRQPPARKPSVTGLAGALRITNAGTRTDSAGPSTPAAATTPCTATALAGHRPVIAAIDAGAGNDTDASAASGVRHRLLGRRRQ